MSAKGVLFSMPPKKQDFGGVLAQFVDSEGPHCGVGAGSRGQLGLYARVAKKLSVSPSYVSRVAQGKRINERIKAQLFNELRKIR